jgi:hypothetical protein
VLALLAAASLTLPASSAIASAWLAPLASMSLTFAVDRSLAAPRSQSMASASRPFFAAQ